MIFHASHFWSTPVTDAYSNGSFWVDMKDALGSLAVRTGAIRTAPASLMQRVR